MACSPLCFCNGSSICKKQRDEYYAPCKNLSRLHCLLNVILTAPGFAACFSYDEPELLANDPYKKIESRQIYQLRLFKSRCNWSEAYAKLTEINNSLGEKLQSQKTEIEELKKQFNIEFENMANKILEEKTEKFTKINQDNLN
ncbi:MAG TPA: hypothetical protein VF008_23115, partial [Niastella sp.]